MKKFTWILLVMVLVLACTAVAGAETYDHVLKKGMKDVQAEVVGEEQETVSEDATEASQENAIVEESNE